MDKHYVFQAVIKSAASAASPKTNSRDQAPGGRRTAAQLADDGGRGAPLDLGPLDLVFGEAALAPDLITAWKSFPAREAALAADFIPAAWQCSHHP